MKDVPITGTIQLTPPTNRTDAEIDRILHRLPPGIRADLDEFTIRALTEALRSSRSNHLIDFRTSTRLAKKRYYIRLLIGEERRSIGRLTSERQISLIKSAAICAVLIWMATSIVLVALVVTLYLVKSWLGIDIFKGPSFLHQFFFD